MTDAATGAERARSGRVIAVLGPTNTGKTHLAIERMLGHRSGMIGFPLRLLARENYDRIVAARGPGAVALITGEEIIVPPRPLYFVCTVEAMPVDREVAFLAVDEIQLCADPDRGHVFTDRLLHARGVDETMFIGAETIRPLVQRLVPRAEVVSRPRLSTLSYAGHKKLTRLPPRSAVVAFSAPDVYALAELIRRQRGGTAVVLGALSPRTRNAQVAMYQAGEVDYLVATDAIGMGLNLALDHVAFARLTKFDGEVMRRLTAPEVAQIAGRAGRHRADGSFGTTGALDGMDDTLVEAVEGHAFDTLRLLRWRNAELKMGSVRELLRSLERRPTRPELARGRDADDHLALAQLARDPEVAASAQGPDRVRLLWDVCCIPDFRKVLSDAHTRLLAQIFHHLNRPRPAGGAGRLPTDWVAAQVTRLDRTEGDIDALVTRIAHIRTWTYIAHRPGWLDDGAAWRERTRAIEDKLSDALHDRLTQRFVDRRSAVLVRSLRRSGELVAAVSRGGEVLVEGQAIGQLDGFTFRPDQVSHSDDGRALMSAARRALTREIASRVARLERAEAAAFHLEDDGRLYWESAPLAQLAPGATVLRPELAPLTGQLLEPAQWERLRPRLVHWLTDCLADGLAPLERLRAAPLTGAARGLAYQLVEQLGACPRTTVAPLLATLGPAERAALRRAGVRIGTTYLFLPALCKPAAVALRALLWAVHHRRPLPVALPPPGWVSVMPDPVLSTDDYAAIGYPVVGPRAIRVDILDRLVGAIGKAPPASADPAWTRLAQSIGVGPAELAEVVEALGWRRRQGADGGELWTKRPVGRRPARPDRGRPAADGPFARLKEIAFAR